MSDTVKLVQDSHAVTATRKHLKKTIDYGNTAELAAYTGKKGELIFNTDSRAINYLDGVTSGGFLPAAALPVANSTTLPVATSAVDGQFYILRTAGANDVILISGKNLSGNYTWQTLGSLTSDVVPPLLTGQCVYTSNSTSNTVVYSFTEKIQLKNHNTGVITLGSDITANQFGVFAVSGMSWNINNPVANVTITSASLNAAGTIFTAVFDKALPGVANTYVIDTPLYDIIDLSGNELADDANAIFTT
jgi:hypothetical protein